MKNHKQKVSNSIPPAAVLGLIAVAVACMAYSLVPRGNPLDKHLPAKPTIAQLKDGDCEQINEGSPGQPLELSRYAVRGKYTIFDFQSVSCPACPQMEALAQELSQYRPDVVVRTIDINRPGVQGIDWGSPLAKQQKITSTPYLKLYGPDCSLLLKGKEATKALVDNINTELIK